MNENPQTETPRNYGVNRRDFIKGGVVAGLVVGGGLGAFWLGYEKALGKPLRIGVLGTGDQGSVLLGALHPEMFEVRSIADIRPYNIWRAFHGDPSSEAAMAVRPGLLKKYGWKSEDEARRHVQVFDSNGGGYEALIANAKEDDIEAVVIALPLHLHARAAVAAMQRGLHVFTEKLMAHTVGECKEMARMADQTGLLLATGHQRHYNVLYANAVDQIQRGVLGELHSIQAQWNRGNLPGKDSWAQPMPKSAKPNDRLAGELPKRLRQCQRELAKASGEAIDLWRARVEQVEAQIADGLLSAEAFGYQYKQFLDGAGNVVYSRPAIEELIRWRLWDRTSAGLMGELGSHQLDAAGIFIDAVHGEKQRPLSVAAASDRPLFPPDREVEDHVYCVVDYPAPGYNADDPIARRKTIGVQYAAINGNGFGGYGETVFGTEGTLILDREASMSVVRGSAAPSGVKVSTGGGGGPTLDTQASGAPMTAAKGPDGGPKASRGYAEELQHWAWCIRNPAPENQPRCGPHVALADAVVALTTNLAARQGTRKEFKKEWFDINSDATPEGMPPSVAARR